MRSARQEFDNAFELLEQFLQELQNYLASHASMKYSRHEREHWEHSFTSQTSWVAAFSAGLRSAVVVMLLGAFWLETAWPSGATAKLIAASTVMLAAGTSNPRLLCFQMGVGTLWGAIVGFPEYFYVLPKIDGFPLLCVALAAPFAFGAFLVSRPKSFGYGVGQLVFFAIGTVPDNMTAYDPAGFLNNYIAMVLAMFLCAAASAIILPPNSRWMWKRLEGDWRNLIRSSVVDRLDGLRYRFQSRVSDLVHQAHGLAAGRPQVQEDFARWMFTVLEVGQAWIRLRGASASLRHQGERERYLDSRLNMLVEMAGSALARLFAPPTKRGYTECLVLLNALSDEIEQQRGAVLTEHQRSGRLQIQVSVDLAKNAVVESRAALSRI